MIRENKSEKIEWIPLTPKKLVHKENMVIVELSKAIPEDCIRLIWDGSAAKSLPPRLNFSLQQKTACDPGKEHSKTFIFKPDASVLGNYGKSALIRINESGPFLLHWDQATEK